MFSNIKIKALASLTAGILGLAGMGISLPVFAVTRINFATIAPEGTSWLKEINKFSDAVKEKTQGKVEIKVYHSSKMGDELDVLRKMRSGQLHAGAFTGVGLGAVHPAIRIMELPFLFEDEAEIDFVFKKMQPTFAKLFETKGMVLLNSGDAGRVFIFSQQPIQNLGQMGKAKIWVWEGDPLASAFFKEAKVSPVALPITEVITALQTGMVNSVYVPPMGAIGFQWWTKVGYMTTPKLNNVAGGILISKKKFDELTPDLRQVVLQEAEKTGTAVTQISRTDNEKAVELLKQNQVRIVAMDESGRKEFNEISLKVRQQLVGTLFSAAVLKEVEGYIQEHRAGKKKS